MAFYFIFKININCFGKPGGWIEIEKRLNWLHMVLVREAAAKELPFLDYSDGEAAEGSEGDRLHERPH